MTDKKYEQLLKCAAALGRFIELAKDDPEHSPPVHMTQVYTDFKACLPPPPPSRLEIADWFDEYLNNHEFLPNPQETTRYFNCILEELRKEQ